ncbi:MAG TPA: hydrolase TatD [Lachnospiraceae bacterium]|nr:hydrolase TatD [Lachnospiraceae bacterium]
MIFETHAHYDDEAFDSDREELISSLPAGGVGTVINVGASMATTRNSLMLAEKYPFVYAAVGVHPDEAEELSEKCMEELRGYCRREKTVAVGEIGLDYYWHKEEEHRKLQQYWFRRQLALAREEGLPFIIHSREAAADTLAILKEERAGEIGGVMHCYSYSAEQAREYVKMGLYIGVGGVVTFKNARKLKEAVEAVPLDRILLETDCPYMAPVPYRGKRNCSLYLPHVAAAIARLKGASEEAVREATEENARRLFGKAAG